MEINSKEFVFVSVLFLLAVYLYVSHVEKLTLKEEVIFYKQRAEKLERELFYQEIECNFEKAFIGLDCLESKIK